MGRKHKKFSFTPRGFPAKMETKTEDSEDTDKSESGSASNSSANLGAFIDHRLHDDLANTHLSPARARRRTLSGRKGSNSVATHQQNSYFANARDDTPMGHSPHGDSPLGYHHQHNPTRRESLPLTNRNLNNFVAATSGGYSNEVYPVEHGNGGSLALDMDQFAREQRQLAGAGSQPWGMSDTNGGGDLSSLNSMEFGESNPLSDHSSDSTSLDDVCFPDYYESGDEDEEGGQKWPDLKVLEEFVREELEEFQEELDAQQAAFAEAARHAMQSGTAATSGSTSPTSFPAHVSFPPVSTEDPVLPTYDESFEDTPLLVNKKINEVESMNLRLHSFRVRPPQIQPWDKSKEMITTILNNPRHPTDANKKSGGGKLLLADPNVCRYTYFREDLDKTIHSANISGLLHSSSKIKEGSPGAGAENADITVEDLFSPMYYSHKGHHHHHHHQHHSSVPSKMASSASSVKIPESELAPMTPMDTGSKQDEEGEKLSSQTSPESVPAAAAAAAAPTATTPAGGSTRGSVSAANAATAAAAASGSSSTTPEAAINPFWLDVLDPTEEEMKVISKTFGIHPLTTEDIFLGEAREKVELFKSYYFICFTSFDVIHERRKQRAKENDKKLNKLQEMYDNTSNSSLFGSQERKRGIWKKFTSMLGYLSGGGSGSGGGGGGSGGSHFHLNSHRSKSHGSSSIKSRTNKKIRDGELLPLNMYMIVFKDAVITFHFSATPHPINVRRRARLLRDFLTVSSDWICYALIDDITDSFAPMIESLEVEVNSIEDAILKMHSGDTDSDDETDDSDDDGNTESEYHHRKQPAGGNTPQEVFFKLKRTKSTVEGGDYFKRGLLGGASGGLASRRISARSGSKSSKSSLSRSGSFKIIGWKRKGDMLRRIGECRKRVMSVLRLLGSKADVIKGFSKRFNETGNRTEKLQEIGMYLGDIQDHIVTMVQSLNHYEKLLARFHSNYLAQINIDMTKVNNDTNDVLGKITILGTIVLPINVVTGLWGMNCIVPGQDVPGLTWFYSIVGAMILFSLVAYNFAKRVTGL